MLLNFLKFGCVRRYLDVLKSSREVEEKKDLSEFVTFNKQLVFACLA